VPFVERGVWDVVARQREVLALEPSKHSSPRDAAGQEGRGGERGRSCNMTYSVPLRECRAWRAPVHDVVDGGRSWNTTYSTHLVNAERGERRQAALEQQARERRLRDIVARLDVGAKG